MEQDTKIFANFAARNEDAHRIYKNDKSKKDFYDYDVHRIMHCPFFNRYSDKTQVFSLRKNDDLTRRATHVQFVARMAYIIGDRLGLNTELIQAIALGHDIGHTPFGHAGERFLDSLYYGYTKTFAGVPRRFFHNVHSVRALRNIYALTRNLTVQTFDGILFHNGEKFDVNKGEYVIQEDGKEVKILKWVPSGKISKNEKGVFCKEGDWQDVKWEEYDAKLFDAFLDECTKSNLVEKYSASTLEGCVVRICDILAYAYKDRQDAIKSKYWEVKKGKKIKYDEVVVQPETEEKTVYEFDNMYDKFDDLNVNFIPSVLDDIVTHSGIDEKTNKPYLAITKDNFKIVDGLKNDNKKYMYIPIDKEIDPFILPIFMAVYAQMRKECIDGIKEEKWDSPIFVHHIFAKEFKKCYRYQDKKWYWKYTKDNIEKTADEIVVDFIASMTDDYIIDLYGYLLNKRKKKDLEKNCFIKIKEKDSKNQKDSKSVEKFKLLWKKELYEIIKDYYSLSYFEEERKKQITVLQILLGIEPSEDKNLIKICKEELKEKKLIPEEGYSEIKNYYDDLIKKRIL
jgi:dGTPase